MPPAVATEITSTSPALRSLRALRCQRAGRMGRTAAGAPGGKISTSRSSITPVGARVNLRPRPSPLDAYPEARMSPDLTTRPSIDRARPIPPAEQQARLGPLLGAGGSP